MKGRPGNAEGLQFAHVAANVAVRGDGSAGADVW